MFYLILITLAIGGYSYEEDDNSKCQKFCVCQMEHISDIPMMKWMKTSLSDESKSQINESTIDNGVYQENQETDLDENPLINNAFCVLQDASHRIEEEEFQPEIGALTILCGPDTINRTIKDELSDFQDLQALEIKGYVKRSVSTNEYSKVSLHPNTFQHLLNLKYLNIEYVTFFLNSNIITDEIQTTVDNESQSYEIGQGQSNITFVKFIAPEIVSYKEYKRKMNIISTFSQLTNLRFLRLHKCDLEVVSWDMFKDLVNLEILNLEGNNIIEISKFAFFSMTHLKTLNLADNKIMRVHSESLEGLLKLKNLDLSKNRLQYISETTFASLPKLRVLNLRENSLETIFNKAFETIKGTTHMYIGSSQKLTIYENAFDGLDYLQKLTITALQIANLDGSLFNNLRGLKYLRVNGVINNLEFDAFINSFNLRELILRNCSLKFVSVDAFYGLRNLTLLDLSWNRLQTLQPGVFDGLYSLNELILSHNNFVTLPGAVFRGLQHVKMLRLEENPWNCSCEMANWVYLNIQKTKEIRTVDQFCTHKFDKSLCTSSDAEFYVTDTNVIPKCVTPDELSGRDVIHVVDKKLNCEKKKRRETSRLRQNREEKVPDNQKFRINSLSISREERFDKDNSQFQHEDNYLTNLSRFVNYHENGSRYKKNRIH